MKQDFIRDGKKVRLCDSNIVKTNPVTYHVHFSKWHQVLFPIAPPKNFFVVILQGLVWFFQITMLGFIFSLYWSHKRIQRAKKDIERNKRFKR